MPEYAGAEEIFHDQDAALEVAQAMFARAEPLTESTPAWAYLVKTRRLPAEAVRGALDQLRYLPPPIAGRPPQDHAVVSLLRDRAGEISGFQATFCDILGAATATEPRRLTCSLRVNGCRDGLFTAGGGAGQRCYLTEGFLEKSLAIAGLGIGPAYGSGGLNVLGFAVATEPEVVLVPDRPPAPDAWTRDGKTRLLDLHTKAYERAVDRLILAGRSVLMAAAPDCDHPCKDADAFLIRHGPIRLADLIERAIPVRLSDEGWKLRLAAMGPAEYDRARKKIADGLGVRVSTLDDMRKGGVSALPDFDDDSQIRDRLVSIAMTGELFHEDGGEAYAAVEIDGGGRTTFRVDRGAFTDWLLAEYGRRFPVVIGGREIPGSASATTIADAMRMIEALARNGEVRPVFLRVGWTDSALYIDMATREPAVIAVTTAGWRIITEAPVHLVHSRSAKPLPMPAPCSRKAVLRRLSEFFGFRPADDRFVLIVGIAVVALMPIGPYPILLLTGEQGSGKTSRSRWLKSVLDPTKALIRGRPKSAEDLAISVWRSWVACFDNLSKLDQDMSDWLCRLSEGGGLPKRKLFTDTEEILIEAARLIILTAIPDVARSGDLIDRAVLVRCEAIRSKVREQVLLSRFEAFLPNFLWYLVEAASCALGRLSGMAHSHDGLRRGDFVAWVEAAAPALGLKEGRFTEAYTRNQEQGVLLALEADPVARALLAYMDRRTTVEMSATLLLAELTPIARKYHGGQLPVGWPSLAHHFSGRLRRLAPQLRRIDCEVEQQHTRTGSLVRVHISSEQRVIVETASRASPASHISEPMADGQTEMVICDAGDARDADSGITRCSGGDKVSGSGHDTRISSAYLTCSTCNCLFPKPARGRPPSRCPACRDRRPAANGPGDQDKPTWRKPSAPETTSPIAAGGGEPKAKLLP